MNNHEGYRDNTAEKAISRVDRKNRRKQMKRTPENDKIHQKCVAWRKKTDEQLYKYVEDRVKKAEAEGYNRGVKDGMKKTATEPAKPEAPVIDFELLLDEISKLPGIGMASTSKIRRLMVEKGLIA